MTMIVHVVVLVGVHARVPLTDWDLINPHTYGIHAIHWQRKLLKVGEPLC